MNTITPYPEDWDEEECMKHAPYRELLIWRGVHGEYVMTWFDGMDSKCKVFTTEDDAKQFFTKWVREG